MDVEHSCEALLSQDVCGAGCSRAPPPTTRASSSLLRVAFCMPAVETSFCLSPGFVSVPGSH